MPDITHLARAITAITGAGGCQVDSVPRRALQKRAAADRGSNAVREGIVSRQRETFAEALLRVQKQRIVASRSAVVPLADVRVF